MKSNLKTARVLLLDASLILVISLAVILLNLFLVHRVDEQLSSIDEARTQKTELIKTMKTIIRQRSIVMVDLAAEKDVWAFQDKYLGFHRLAVEFIGIRDQLVELGLDAGEQAALDAALQTIRTTEPLQTGIVERLREAIMQDRIVAGISDEIARTDFPIEFALLGQMEDLLESVVRNANQQRELARNDFDRIQAVSGALSFVSLLTIVLLMSRSLRKITAIESDLIKRTESLSWDATHDPLTNVYNRRWLEYKVDHLVENPADTSIEHSLACVDLDGFKAINDQHGHQAGDRFLVELCREIEHAIRQNDTFCRVGGDEFAILLENCDQQNATKVANELLNRVRNFHVDFEGAILQVTCSIGICQFKADDIEFDDLVRRADELCYEAKRLGKNRVEIGVYE